MRFGRLPALILLCAAALLPSGCQEKKTRSITIEGPEKKREIKIETTEKKEKPDKK